MLGTHSPGPGTYFTAPVVAAKRRHGPSHGFGDYTTPTYTDPLKKRPTPPPGPDHYNVTPRLGDDQVRGCIWPGMRTAFILMCGTGCATNVQPLSTMPNNGTTKFGKSSKDANFASAAHYVPGPGTYNPKAPRPGFVASPAVDLSVCLGWCAHGSSRHALTRPSSLAYRILHSRARVASASRWPRECSSRVRFCCFLCVSVTIPVISFSFQRATATSCGSYSINQSKSCSPTLRQNRLPGIKFLENLTLTPLTQRQFCFAGSKTAEPQRRCGHTATVLTPCAVAAVSPTLSPRTSDRARLTLATLACLSTATHSAPELGHPYTVLLGA